MYGIVDCFGTDICAFGPTVSNVTDKRRTARALRVIVIVDPECCGTRYNRVSNRNRHVYIFGISVKTRRKRIAAITYGACSFFFFRI